MKQSIIDFFSPLTEVGYTDFLVSTWEVLSKAFLVILLITVGWIIARAVRSMVRELVKKVKLDSLLKKVGFDYFFKKADIKLDSAVFLGETTKWLVFIGFFMVVLEQLGFTQVNTFVGMLLAVILKIVIAIIIFGVAVVASRFILNITGAVVKILKVKNSELLSKVVSGIIYFTALVIVLDLFSVTQVLVYYINTIVSSATLGLALAFGLAFGLGGKERAKEILDKLK